eukprot:CAMPEP_0177645576 /NCGR_PEP_ID=MMETSP0447-20121125/9323_1 /TAXON_ID=0 /ORGANISM="Stygamoeba regulata, Strain BSH-02190019" /LENGTH=472 /DNA_ID=CAMNT_0019148069 /DNA_START=67 /DNA_END=1485 /DNA_ORIENTATION=-
MMNPKQSKRSLGATLIALAVLLALCAPLVFARNEILQAHMGCHSKTPVYGPENLYPIFTPDMSTPPLRTATNGKAWLINLPMDGLHTNTTQAYWLAHLYGSPYEQGFAQGALFKKEVHDFLTKAWVYMADQALPSLLPFMPEWLAALVVDLGFEAALDYVADITKAYTSPDIFEEMQGLSDSSGVPYKTILRVSMVPGLTKGACSIIGAWGKAVPQNLLQLRALDWDTDGPFRDYSQVTVYHPDPTNSTQGHGWVNIGFTGFLGALTGVSSKQLAISEIGVSYPDASFGNTGPDGKEGPIPIAGYPFIFLLRDILKFDETIDDAANRMINTKRTCDLILAVGDGKEGEVRAFQYSPHVLNIQDDKNQMPYNETWHPRIDDIVYYGMDWVCPSFNYVLSRQLQKYYGEITAEVGIRSITSVLQSGSNHLAYYDLTAQEVYFAFMAPHGVGGPEFAYDRQFTKLSVPDLLAVSL